MQTNFINVSRRLVKGDKIVLANGQWSDVELVADATGSPDAWITVEAEEPGKVIITGNSRLRIAGSSCCRPRLAVSGCLAQVRADRISQGLQAGGV